MYLLVMRSDQPRAVVYVFLHLHLRALFMTPVLKCVMPYVWALYKLRRSTQALGGSRGASKKAESWLNIMVGRGG